MRAAAGTIDEWRAFEGRGTAAALEAWLDEARVKPIDNGRPADDRPFDQGDDPMTQFQCQTCHPRVAGCATIQFGSIEAGYRDLCSRCFNEEVARIGLGGGLNT